MEEWEQGAIGRTDFEEHTHPFGQSAFAAKNVVEPIPAAFLSQKRLDYDVRTDENPVYVGFNVRGAVVGDNTWVIQKLTYDASNRVTLVQIAIDTWNNRASASYG